MIWSGRKIIHVDMDAFYASVEQRDHPELKGKPVIVGGDPDKRGVVASCSYEARKYGVRSAMSSVRAKALCPHAVYIHPDFEKYRRISAEIMEIFREYTDLVEPTSLDEAYLDVTRRCDRRERPEEIAEEIRKRIKRRTGLTASSGISYNKFISKIASDINKPDGLKVVTPEEAWDFLGDLPIGKFHGIGKATESRMREVGILKGENLRRFSLDEMRRFFGKVGIYYYHIVRGIDERPVKSSRTRKSLGKERTLVKNINGTEEIMGVLREISEEVEKALSKRNMGGTTLTLKIRYADFTTKTRSHTVDFPIYEASTMLNYAGKLLKSLEPEREVRLLGLSISNLVTYGETSDFKQTSLNQYI